VQGFHAATKPLLEAEMAKGKGNGNSPFIFDDLKVNGGPGGGHDRHDDRNDRPNDGHKPKPGDTDDASVVVTGEQDQQQQQQQQQATNTTNTNGGDDSNANTTDVDVAIDFGGGEWIPRDDDLIDVDLFDNASMGDV